MASTAETAKLNELLKMVGWVRLGMGMDAWSGTVTGVRTDTTTGEGENQMPTAATLLAASEKAVKKVDKVNI